MLVHAVGVSRAAPRSHGLQGPHITAPPSTAAAGELHWCQNSGVGTHGHRKCGFHGLCLSWDEGRGEELSSLAETGEEGT